MSLNRYNSTTGQLDNIASGQRVVIYTKAAYEAAKSAGTLPADTLVMITDDVKEGGGMPALDYANPLYSFNSTHKSYTATKDCYLYGMIIGANAKIYVDSTEITIRDHGTSSVDVSSVSCPLKITNGSTVTVDGSVTDATATLRIYDVIS